MTPRLSIKIAEHADLDRVERLLARDSAALPVRLDECIDDGAVLLAEHRGRLSGVVALDVAEAEIGGMFVRPGMRNRGLGRRLVEATERLAVRFGLLRLGVGAPADAVEFFRACGYRPFDGAGAHADENTGRLELYLRRHFPQRQTRYGARIRRLLQELGIPKDYGRRRRLALQEEAADLVEAGDDAFGRPARLTAPAHDAWQRMVRAASRDGVTLQIASAFRSVEYQAGLVQRKLERGQRLEKILRVSAAPGFSEHHTGRAIDVTTPDSEPLEESFEATPAHDWLQRHGAEFGFTLSYPRDNRHGICFEPWHWCFRA